MGSNPQKTVPTSFSKRPSPPRSAKDRPYLVQQKTVPTSLSRRLSLSRSAEDRPHLVQQKTVPTSFSRRPSPSRSAKDRPHLVQQRTVPGNAQRWEIDARGRRWRNAESCQVGQGGSGELLTFRPWRARMQSFDGRTTLLHGRSEAGKPDPFHLSSAVLGSYRLTRRAIRTAM